MMPQAWYAACRDGIRQVLDSSGTSAEAVAGLGLSNMIGTVAPLASDGEPLAPAIAYYDTRSRAQARWVLERAPEILSITGNRVTAGNTSICSALWLCDQRPDVWRQTTALATAGSGDVFAGTIGGFLAQGLAPIDAAALAFYVGTRAARRAEQRFGTLGLLAGDLPPAIAEELAALEATKRAKHA